MVHDHLLHEISERQKKELALSKKSEILHCNPQTYVTFLLANELTGLAGLLVSKQLSFMYLLG